LKRRYRDSACCAVAVNVDSSSRTARAVHTRARRALIEFAPAHESPFGKRAIAPLDK
jgi:hypothetical protein